MNKDPYGQLASALYSTVGKHTRQALGGVGAVLGTITGTGLKLDDFKHEFQDYLVAELPGLLSVPGHMETGTMMQSGQLNWENKQTSFNFDETEIEDARLSLAFRRRRTWSGRMRQSWRRMKEAGPCSAAAGSSILTQANLSCRRPVKWPWPADEKEAWVLWCEKAIRTPRYRHLIYSRDYGSELEELIGSGNRAIQESEIRRMVSETLLADARTQNVDQFVFEWEGESCRFACRITNIRDEEAVLEGSVG
ncbi:hypothetical protein CM49_01804 [Paenibacillus sp. P1XP2]|nr:hypothetical protein CM49_01804 [Paenibacillus sp. P1XP2]